MICDIINKYNDLGIKYITDIYTDNAIYVFICSLPNGRFMVYENTDPQYYLHGCLDILRKNWDISNKQSLVSKGTFGTGVLTRTYLIKYE